MPLSKYLKSQLIDFVDTYRRFYPKTLGATVIFTLFTFLIVALLFHFSIFDKTSSKKQISLLSYFFVRYSFADTSSIVDLSKTVFVFFVSMFSITLIRVQNDSLVKKDFGFFDFIKRLNPLDLGYLIIALVISIITDYYLFKLYEISARNNGGSLLDKWIHGILFLLECMYH